MLSKEEKSEWADVIALAQRRVRTAEGARQFGEPIGAPIGELGEAEDGQKRPITIERLRSLQDQFMAAKKVGDLSGMKKYQAQFTSDLRIYRSLKQDPELLRKLTAGRGRQSQRIREQ